MLYLKCTLQQPSSFLLLFFGEFSQTPRVQNLVLQWLLKNLRSAPHDNKLILVQVTYDDIYENHRHLVMVNRLHCFQVLQTINKNVIAC